MQQIAVFATPSLGHAVCLEYLTSALQTNGLMWAQQRPHAWTQLAGDCFIAKVRSKMVDEFLVGAGTDLFFIDDDLGWPPGKVLEFLDRPEPIVAGVYPKRMDTRDWPVALGADAETGELIEHDGLIRAVHAPTGFMRIKRDVLAHLVELSPTFRDAEKDGVIKEYRAVFNAGPGADGWWWGEDYHFCNLASANGYEIWVDPNIEFSHRGDKRYTGTLADGLDTFRARARAAVHPPAPKFGAVA